MPFVLLMTVGFARMTAFARQTIQQAVIDDGVLGLPGFPIHGEVLLQVLHQVPTKRLVQWSVVSQGFASTMRRPEVFRHFNLDKGALLRKQFGGERNLLALLKQPLNLARFGLISDLSIPYGTTIGEKTFTKLSGAFAIHINALSFARPGMLVASMQVSTGEKHLVP